jgi:hypothetical protein
VKPWTFYWAMHPAFYCCIVMAIEIASVLPSFFVVTNFIVIVAHNSS